jgi:hypothetical protein
MVYIENKQNSLYNNKTRMDKSANRLMPFL